MSTFPAVVRFAIVLLGAVAVAADAHAAGVFRCPDGSYQDKPCGDGGKLVTKTSREAPPEKGQDAQCLARAKLAEKFARDKAGGTSPEDILARVDKEMMPYEERVARKKFAAEVLQMKGGPTEVKATVEAECMEKKADAAREAAEKKAAAEQAAAAMAKEEAAAREAQAADNAARQTKYDEERRKERCESARQSFEMAKNAERRGGSIDSLDSMRAATRSAEARVRKDCG